MNLDSFFPAKDRFALAMALNNLLAAPGFEAWMQGTPLNAKNLLYTDEGKPRISVMAISHLDDAQRMFFVSMLLNELIGWMRAQPGTSSLRAILYMDEIFGYMPPVANPPSKKLFLTLLKQARAYGLGLVLATQNPVDLDYKGLSNTGTWFIGRLQTERDKARVMEGLEGASAGNFDKQAMERTIAGLGKRRFLLHNVHEDEPVVFNTRWVLSYLAGPLTRDHIRTLMKTAKNKIAAVAKAASKPKRKSQDAAPALPPSIDQYFVPGSGEEIVYSPATRSPAATLSTPAPATTSRTNASCCTPSSSRMARSILTGTTANRWTFRFETCAKWRSEAELRRVPGRAGNRESLCARGARTTSAGCGKTRTLRCFAASVSS